MLGVAEGLLASLLLLGLVQGSETGAKGPLRVGVVVFDGFLTSEVAAPVEVLGAANRVSAKPLFQIEMIGTRSGVVTSGEGLRLHVDRTIADAASVEVLIVPSATTMEGLLGDQKLVDFIALHGRRVQFLVSHCAGAFLLGKAGLLKGRRVTTYPGGEKALQAENPAAEVVAAPVVVDENLMTSSGALVSYRASLQLLEMLTGDPELRAAVAGELYLSELVGDD